ncbi:MAG: hypothetical protein JWR61_1032 [Ferruginibacter sp.]|uniref:hypothetical protein n=1 Tax=Ferruginibacter sp. TaxID=1940288 RepID=UPI0026589031|nr:hypothetical protein [Ferruginibacter sp.]MDB5276077.1 hypothetical protein [Ferruginibacter sp.]
MPVKRKIPFDNGHFFITFTCYNWLHLFDLTHGYDLVYNWFDILKAQGHYITGFVIMPNHVHATIAFRKTAKGINTIIGDGKRFIGYSIVERLKKSGYTDVLEQLENAVNKSDKKRGKLHEVWEDSFDWKECISDAFTWQKLDYMHENPCAGKWRLAENAIGYIHSSARYYILGIQGFYPVLNFKELHDIDLTSAS